MLRLIEAFFLMAPLLSVAFFTYRGYTKDQERRKKYERMSNHPLVRCNPRGPHATFTPQVYASHPQWAMDWDHLPDSVRAQSERMTQEAMTYCRKAAPKIKETDRLMQEEMSPARQVFTAFAFLHMGSNAYKGFKLLKKD